MADARSAILGAIAAALRDEPAREPPEPAPLFGNEVAPGRRELARQFRSELEALGGEVRFVRDVGGLPEAVAGFFAERGLTTAAAASSLRVRGALAQLGQERWFAADGAGKHRIEAADCAVIEAQSLLADTGSLLVIASTYGERLLPYLPRTCIAIADADRLYAHMADAAMAPAFEAARAGACGEACIITGPSRSADIEKTLVLGAHGPQAVVVFLTGLV